jgi:hypothetical protein
LVLQLFGSVLGVRHYVRCGRSHLTGHFRL